MKKVETLEKQIANVISKQIDGYCEAYVMESLFVNEYINELVLCANITAMLGVKNADPSVGYNGEDTLDFFELHDINVQDEEENDINVNVDEIEKYIYERFK